jgi:hypothetical protein
VQEELLSAHSKADLRVYAIWFNMYPTDRRERWPGDVLTDSRVVHYWDEQKSVGAWYAPRTGDMESQMAPGSRGLGGPVLWDAYLVYGPEARWEDAPTDLRRWGRTILATQEPFREAVDALLKSSNTSIQSQEARGAVYARHTIDMVRFGEPRRSFRGSETKDQRPDTEDPRTKTEEGAICPDDLCISQFC